MGSPRFQRGLIAETNDVDFLTVVRVISLDGDESGDRLGEFVHPLRGATVLSRILSVAEMVLKMTTTSAGAFTCRYVTLLRPQASPCSLPLGACGPVPFPPLRWSGSSLS